MKIINYPLKDSWDTLCRRPRINYAGFEKTVSGILKKVKSEGDHALFQLSEEFDGVKLDSLKVTETDILQSASYIHGDLKNAINTARLNIEKFHSSQGTSEQYIETMEGVRCWRKSLPLDRVGLYIPGGSAPLFSTVLMLAIPAKIAGCQEIILCTPPDKTGKINPLILYAASITGVTEVFSIGGAQAIAAMAYGTESVSRVDKIFGPGNQYVTKAKELVQLDGIPIDMPAGPSEVLVIADGSADPAFIASDLLSQAEHGTDSQVIMVTDSPAMIKDVRKEILEQLDLLPRKDIATKALENSSLILLNSISDCIGFSNNYAPEHLIISTVDPESHAAMVRNAGSVFLGRYSCESTGDYASGTNHTLPTYGYARNFSGVSVESFIKRVTFQEVTAEGIRNIGPVVELMAEAEGLQAHKNAVSLRLKSLDND